MWTRLGALGTLPGCMTEAQHSWEKSSTKHSVVGKVPSSSPRMCCLLFINITKINHQGFQMERDGGRTIQTGGRAFYESKGFYVLSLWQSPAHPQGHHITVPWSQAGCSSPYLAAGPTTCTHHSPLLSVAALRLPLTARLPACSQACNCFCSNLSTSNNATSSLCSPVCNAFLLSIDFVSISH